jgi:type III secretory pathway component EscV
MRAGLFYELGVILPEVRLQFDKTLETNQLRFAINGRTLAPAAGLSADEFLVNDTADRLKLHKIKSRDAVNPANDHKCAVVRIDDATAEACRQIG